MVRLAARTVLSPLLAQPRPQPLPLAQAQRPPSSTMAWRSGGSSNAELISNLERHGLLSRASVLRAFRATDRAHYVPGTGGPRRAYDDSPSPIGHGATISAPHMHAAALESLAPAIERGGNVLDVGSGSGYLVAVLSRLLQEAQHAQQAGSSSGSTATVVGIDHIPELVDMSRNNLIADGLGGALESGQIKLVTGDGRAGYAARAPYAAIHVGAAAPPHVPDTLAQQLAPRGKMFVPVASSEEPGASQYIWEYEKDEHGAVTKRKLMGVMYVPLTDEEAQRSTRRY